MWIKSAPFLRERHLFKKRNEAIKPYYGDEITFFTM